MKAVNNELRKTHYEKKRIRISTKRQITIPSKYFDALGLSDELECIYANEMLILKPVEDKGLHFAEEIIADLIEQGYSGQELLVEFRRISHQIRPAVENMIADADQLAKEALNEYTDHTDEIFKVHENAED
ncbi:MAG: AbrB/MazE/SpoVT family DNA-binding domain-containing protein [Firmicutes bacterium]|nr:AbrB/MazE/SpoVT family DNA-binding domain-containing protein [Bacillota bacterium]